MAHRNSSRLARPELAVMAEYRNYLLQLEHRNKPRISIVVLLRYLMRVPTEIQSLIIERYLRDGVFHHTSALARLCAESSGCLASATYLGTTMYLTK